MRNTRLWLLVLPVLAISCGDAGSPSSPSLLSTSAAQASQAGKVDVCHIGEDGVIKLHSVGGKAVAAHLGHGDVLPTFTIPVGSTFSASNVWNGNLPAFAFNGDASLTGWNSGLFPVQWLEVDFGSPQRFSVITGLVNVTPDTVANHDITFDGVPAFSWTGFTAAFDVLSHTFPTMQAAQRVRITTTVSDSWGAWFEIGFKGC